MVIVNVNTFSGKTNQKLIRYSYDPTFGSVMSFIENVMIMLYVLNSVAAFLHRVDVRITP